MITLLLVVFCWSAFATEIQRQDTTRRKQDTTRHPGKKKMPAKKKNPKWPDQKRDTMKRNPMDTTRH